MTFIGIKATAIQAIFEYTRKKGYTFFEIYKKKGYTFFKIYKSKGYTFLS